MDKATDEVVDEFEVKCFQQRAPFDINHLYDRNKVDAIRMSTDRDTRLLHVLLYPCSKGDTNVALGIKKGGKCLSSCTSSHTKTEEDIVAVKVIGDGGVHGITLQAGHRYDVMKMTGNESNYGYGAVAEVTVQGVKFSFSKLNNSKLTTDNTGPIAGFRFALL